MIKSPAPIIWVIIPYYQRQPGLLRRAIKTVLAQRDCGEPNILIVDDGSPSPALPEMEDLRAELPNHIHLIEKTNSGAAAARNSGLNNLPDDTEYVAFLDSDDEWPPSHLANALTAFNFGAEFYFANHKREDWENDKFSQIGLNLALHNPIDVENNLYEYRGDKIIPIIRDHMIQTSTVVYCWSKLSGLRFPETLPLFEDDTFWIQSFQRNPRIIFRTDVESFMGKGVNISQAGDWGSQRSLELMTKYAKFWAVMPNLFIYDAEVDGYRITMQNNLTKEFIATLLHRIRRGQGVPINLLLAFSRYNPSWIIAAPRTLISILNKR